jgi:hypothetical protein
MIAVLISLGRQLWKHPSYQRVRMSLITPRAIVISLRKRIHKRRFHQRTRVEGTEKRWHLIKSRISGAKSLLDIGSNIGVLTETAARAGLFALGLEADWQAVSVARRNCKPNLPLAYMHLAVTPSNVTALPTADVVLCLSVYHHWHRDFGHDGAQHILRMLVSKAQQTLWFEPPSRRSKYWAMPPDFVDHDLNSIVEYNLGMLSEVASGAKVVFVGRTPASEGEKFRCLFVIETAGVNR